MSRDCKYVGFGRELYQRTEMTMNLQSVVMVIMRLGAISGFLQGMSYIWMLMTQPYFSDREVFGSQTTTMVVLAAGTMVATTLMWILALPIARKVAHGSDQKLTIGPLTAEQFYKGIFLGVGVYYAVAYLASVLDWTFILFKSAASSPGTEWMRGIKGHDVFVIYASFAFGIMLIAYSGALAAVVTKRDAQTEPAVADEKR